MRRAGSASAIANSDKSIKFALEMDTPEPCSINDALVSADDSAEVAFHSDVVFNNRAANLEESFAALERDRNDVSFDTSRTKAEDRLATTACWP